MLFKNVFIFNLTKSLSIDVDQLNASLEKEVFIPCTSTESSSAGWHQPKNWADLTRVYDNRYYVFCLRKQEKIIPSAAINEKLAEKIETIESESMRKLSRKERAQLKEEVYFNYLPRALTKSSLTYAYLDINSGLLVVDASSQSSAEELCSLLRESLGSLPAVPASTVNIPMQVMTKWMRDSDTPPGISLGGNIVMSDLQEAGCTIRCKNQDLQSSEITAHIMNGLGVKELRLQWRDRIEFTLTEGLAIRSINYMDVVLELIDDADEEDVFDSEFTVMAGELSLLIRDIFHNFGGLLKSDESKQIDIEE